MPQMIPPTSLARRSTVAAASSLAIRTGVLATAARGPTAGSCSTPSTIALVAGRASLARSPAGLRFPAGFSRAYTTPPTLDEPTRISGKVKPGDRAPTPDAIKYVADAAGRREPSTPLQKLGQGVEGRHFTDEPALAVGGSAPADLSEPFHGNWTLIRPAYSKAALDSVKVVHRPEISLSDKVAARLVKLLRFGFDLVSRYKHAPMPAEPHAYTVEQLRQMNCVMSPAQWLQRILFLEVIAGIPGMVAGTVRHLQSLRLMKRDGGWIHTLLEEAENERMHLLSFLALEQPGIFFRALILGAQGVFYNVLFISYLLSPRSVHRFVGFLEEEAVVTYTKCLDQMQSGYLPEWKDKKAPEIAINYWRMDKDATLYDMIKNVRADEANHRFVNHTLASLNQRNDFNPFAIAEPDETLKATVPGFTRDEAAAFAKRSKAALEAKAKAAEEKGEL